MSLYILRFHLECNPSTLEQISHTCANRELRSTSSILRVHLKGLSTMYLEHIHFSYSTQIESLFLSDFHFLGNIYCLLKIE